MIRNLAKTPLTAVLYTSVILFLTRFLTLLFPFSQPYSEALAALAPTLTGYLILLGYALLICVAAALVYSEAQVRGLKLLLLTVPAFMLLQWAAPMLVQFFNGDPSGLMSQMDTAIYAAHGCIGSIILLALCFFLFHPKHDQDAGHGKDEKSADAERHPPKRKIKLLHLAICLVALPFIFLALFIPAWYFLGWSNDFVRVYYGGTGNQGFVVELVNLLLDNAMVIPLTMIRGLAYALFSIPLMLCLPRERIMFLTANAMLYLSGAVLMMIPNPAIPPDAALGLLIEQGALLLPYGVLAGFLLHTSFEGERESGEAGDSDASLSAEPKSANSKKAAKKELPDAAKAIAAATKTTEKK